MPNDLFKLLVTNTYTAFILLATLICSYPSVSLADLPQDQRYWRYHNWYKNHSILHLIVDGTDTNHLANTLSTREKLRRSNISLGEVAIIGTPDPRIISRRSKKPDIWKLTEKFKLGSSRLNSSEVIVEKYKIKKSPTWIIRFRGKDYVFEGLKNPKRLFTSEGLFRGAL